jgi:hypothetical protein
MVGPDLGALATPRTMLAAKHLRLAVLCERCGHSRDADLKALVDDGRAHVAWNKLRFRCSACGSRRTTAEIRGAHQSVGTVA